MELIDLQKQIINKNLDLFYIFTGDEIAIQKIYINKIAEVANLEIEYTDSFKNICNKLQQNNIFNTKKLYVILDDMEFTKQEKAWLNFDYSMNNGNLIIFKFNNLDKRGKYYKNYTQSIIEFNRLSDDVLIQYINKDLPTLSKDNCKKLIDICNGSYNQILLEIDKIQNYQHNKEVINMNIDFTMMEINGLFHKEISDITFDFIDKVMHRDIENIYKLYGKLLQIGESNIKLLSLLYTNFKTILLIQSCDSKDICKTTGLQYYQVKYNQDKINVYSTGELVYILRKIQEIESSIKKGLIDEAITIDYLLINIL